MSSSLDRTLFQLELSALLGAAMDRYAAEATPPIIYTVSLWVDPDARVSVLAIDTEESSASAVARANEWASKHYQRLMANGEEAAAALFRPAGGRNTNPADFAYRSYAQIENTSFPLHWAERTSGRCWKRLKPELFAFVPKLLAALSRCRCHPLAELGVNGPRDWYEFKWQVGGGAA